MKDHPLQTIRPAIIVVDDDTDESELIPLALKKAGIKNPTLCFGSAKEKTSPNPNN